MKGGIAIRACAMALLASTAACGPQISKKTRIAWKPYDSSEFRQTRSGVTVENKEFDRLPPTFFAQTQACDAQGTPIFDTGKPVEEQSSLAQPGQLWYQVSVTNDTDHILRLTGAVVRLFDPAGNQFEPLAKQDVLGEYIGACPARVTAQQKFMLLKFLDRNAEIVPHTTATGWIAFHPASVDVPGTWKLALYEVPVETDEAGKVSRTERFELRTLATKFEDTYQADSPFEAPKLVSSRELSE